MSLWPEPGVILLAAAVPAALMMFLLCFAGRIGPRSVTRRRVSCPLHQRDATVDFVVESDDGEVHADVVSCSLIGSGREIDCSRSCRSTGVARFDTARTAC